MFVQELLTCKVTIFSKKKPRHGVFFMRGGREKENVEEFSTVKCLVFQDENCIFASLIKQLENKMNFLKEKYWISMSDDVLKMSRDIVVTS